MAIGTYTELQTAVENYLARDDLTARIPEFITLAEAKFNRRLRTQYQEARQTATVDPDTTEPEMMSLPTNFQSIRSIKVTSISGKPRLEYMTDAQMDEYRTRIGNVAGQPRYYSIFGDELELCPTPDGEYTIEMKYRQFIPPLSGLNPTNWLLTLAPDAYLYGTLLETAPYMNNDPRLQTWGAGLADAIDGLNGLSRDSGYGSGPLVIKQTGITP